MDPRIPSKADTRNATASDVAQASYWEDIYRAEATPGWDIAQPNPELVWQLEYAQPRLTPGSVIVPGCGFGHDALCLAKQGFAVTAVDMAPSAIAMTQRHAASAGVRLDAIESDLFALPTALDGAFDYFFEHTCFCAIHPSHRTDYARLAARLLKPGGQVIGCFYHHRREGGPPWDTTPEAVRKAFEPDFDCQVLSVAQHSVERRAGAELWARFYRR